MIPLLSASSISFAYRKGVAALTDISLQLNPGQILTLIGPNGSGKSTLIKALLGQMIASGEIRWRGQRIHDWPARELARLVAYLPQSPAYDPQQTIAEVLQLGRAPYWQWFGLESDRDARIVTDIATRLSLTDLLQRSMETLSGGQRQRVFLGRCLVQEPKALLLDEPGTHLDLRHQIDMLQLLRKLANENQIAVLMASHDLNLAASVADRMLLLQDGRVTADGPPREVMIPEILSRAFGVEFRASGYPCWLMPIVTADANPMSAYDEDISV